MQQQLRASGRVIRGRIGVGIEGVSKEVVGGHRTGRTAARCAGQLGREGRACGEGRGRGRRCDPALRRARHRAFERPAAYRRWHQAWHQLHAHRVPQGHAARPQGAGRRDAAGPSAQRPRPPKRRSRQHRPTRSASVSPTCRRTSSRNWASRPAYRSTPSTASPQRRGCGQGDIITQMNSTEVQNARQFNEAVAKLDPKKDVAVLVRRGEASRFVIIRR